MSRGHLPKDLTSDEAEAQVRALLATADIRDAKLDTFVMRLPTLRTSDLFGYLADHVALTTALGILWDGIQVEGNFDRQRLISYAAVLAIKDEIDRRFPIPGGPPP